MLRKSTLYNILLLINIFCVIAILISLLGSTVSPSKFVIPIYLILGFPIIVIINIFFVIFWISFRRWYFLISMIVLLISYKQISTIFPINFPEGKTANKLPAIESIARQLIKNLFLTMLTKLLNK